MSSLFERLRQRQVARRGLADLGGAGSVYEPLSLVGREFPHHQVRQRVQRESGRS